MPSPANWPNNDDRPVEKVSWEDAQVFLTRLNQLEQTAGRLPSGWKYVLPTEAQWEYACRAGTTTIFSWGNSATSTQANFDGTQPYGGGASGTKIQTNYVDVGQYGANPWGFFDMHGNVWEWVHDWKANYPGRRPDQPRGSGIGLVPGQPRWFLGQPTGRTCVPPGATPTPRAPATTTLASVLVSKQSSKIRRIPNWNCSGEPPSRARPAKHGRSPAWPRTMRVTEI